MPTTEEETVTAQELTAKKRAALNRLKTVRGHLDGIIRMLETDAYCVDVMKQISVAQSALERTNRPTVFAASSSGPRRCSARRRPG
jgi:hypothetical protein